MSLCYEGREAPWRPCRAYRFITEVYDNSFRTIQTVVQSRTHQQERVIFIKMSKHHEQPSGYQPGPPYPTSPAYNPHAEPSPAGFTYPQQSLGGAYPGPPQSYPGTQQPHNITQPNIVLVQPSHPSTYVMTTAVPVISTGMLPSDPARVTCPSCREMITTRVDRKASTRTHLIALTCCLLLLWPCCLLPYCMKSCKNANHYCPRCGAFVGQGLNL
ncbi:hypothetical protein B566_EDAN011244 [Ephemera danica]|nr:hypothetical protein B566_EDAN011244 [Ephemera danica]